MKDNNLTMLELAATHLALSNYAYKLEQFLKKNNKLDAKTEGELTITKLAMEKIKNQFVELGGDVNLL